MNRITPYVPIVLVTLCSILISGWFYGDIFFNPNQHLFGNSGDGIKNYYNPCYYMKYDSGVRTDAFIYPYGEIALFTDSHFSYVYLLNLIDDHIVEINSFAVGFINLAMIWSSVICSIFLFLILRYFKLPNWYAVIVALIITFLSPQQERLTAHFSLSWSFFIPMIWYFLLRMMEWKKPLIWQVLIIFSLLFFGLLHPYYLPAGMFFLLGFAGFYILQQIHALKSHYKQIISLLFVSIIPFLIFSGFISYNEIVTDRHLSPYGMFVYNTTFEGAFMPHRGFTYKFLNNLFVITTPKNAEGYAYIGIVGIFALIFTALRMLWNLLKSKRLAVNRIFVNSNLGISVLAAGLLFFLATGNLFKYFGFLLDWMPQLRQFRSLGRFAWVLYYCFGVYAAYLLYLCYRTLCIRGWRPVGLLLLGSLGGVWALESFEHTSFYIGRIPEYKISNSKFYKGQDYFTKALAESGHKTSDFQAVIGFPYINNGTEKLYIYRKGTATLDMMKCSYEIGLPIATFHSPRASIKHGTQLAQLLSSEFIKKEILADFNDKPLLLIEAKGKVWPASRRLLDKAEVIYSDYNIKLYKADLSVFNTNHKRLTEQYNLIKNDLIKGNDYWTTKPTNAVTLKRFPIGKSHLIFRHHGVFQSGKSKSTVVFEGRIRFDSVPEPIEISAWMYLDKHHASIPILRYEELDPSGKVVQFKEYVPKFYTEVIKDYAKATIKVKPLNFNNKIKVIIKTENDLTWNNTFADVLIRPENVDVYFDIKTDSSFVLNNYFIDFNRNTPNY